MTGIEGIILVNKPKNMSSFHVVQKIRKISQVKKVGHAGTLDPLANGLLIIVLGKYTKLSQELTAHDKVYETVITLGISTTTDDLEGEIISKTDASQIAHDEIKEALKKNFIGKIEQSPPKFSAIKINGQRAYKLARQNQDFSIPKREIEIFNLDILKISLPDIYLSISCSKGTYIRSIARDLGNILKVGGIAKEIKRVASGQFSLTKAVNLEDLTKENIKDYLISFS